jgi:hypothetical protein
VTAKRLAAFATGVAAVAPAWALAMLVRSPGWAPVLALAAAVLWLRAGVARAGLAGTAVGVAGVGLAVHPGVLVLLAVLGGAAAVRRRAEIHDLPAGAADEARRVRRLFRLATSAPDAGEVRVLGLGPYLLEEHGRATRVVLAARTAAARRVLFGEVWRGLAVAGTVLGTVLITVWLRGDGAALFAAAWSAAIAGHQAYR